MVFFPRGFKLIIFTLLNTTLFRNLIDHRLKLQFVAVAEHPLRDVIMDLTIPTLG